MDRGTSAEPTSVTHVVPRDVEDQYVPRVRTEFALAKSFRSCGSAAARWPALKICWYLAQYGVRGIGSGLTSAEKAQP